MTERTFVEKIQEAIKASPSLRGAVVFKHAETLTSGIPDLSVTCRGTSWIEVKYLRKGERFQQIMKKKVLQVITADKLAAACDGRCWFVVYEDAPKRTVIWQPKALFKHLWPKLTVAKMPELFFHDGSMQVCEAVSFYGGIYVNGHQHAMVAELLTEAAV